ncbi:hypothetical protein LDENG_00177400, partial [Lucifuga dentata]
CVCVCVCPRVRPSVCPTESLRNQSSRSQTQEGQSGHRTVHIHSHSVRHRGQRETDGHFSVIVPDRVTFRIRTSQTPGLIIYSKPAVITVSFPADSSVTH